MVEMYNDRMEKNIYRLAFVFIFGGEGVNL